MTIEEFARACNAKRVSRGNWLALCPSHGDRVPSFGIWEGNCKRGPQKIMFKCRSQGCPPEAILDAMGLTWRDILGDRVTDPRKLRELDMKRKQEEADRKRRNYRNRVLIDQCRFWEDRYLHLAVELAAHDSDETAHQFHWALDRFRTLEAQVAPILHPKGFR